jgi:uncharacterized protein YggE
MQFLLRSLVLFVAFFTIPVFANSGTIQITGRGVAESAPEFTLIQVGVISRCYDTSREAKDSNAILANKIVDLLKTFARGQHDKVTASGGPNVRQTEYVQEPGGKMRVICEMKWRASNSLNLEMADISRIAELQDEILKLIDEESTKPEIVKLTYGTLSQPGFNVRAETRLKLRKEAQQKAWADAKFQYDNFAEKCPFKNPQLKTVKEPQFFAQYARGAEKAVPGEPTPIIPNEIEVHANWTFIWQFEPSAACAD